MRNRLSLPLVDALIQWDRYVYFCRDWWDGATSDVTLVGMRDDGTCRKVVRGQGDHGPKQFGHPEARPLFDGKFDSKRLANALRAARELALDGIGSQEAPIIMTHFDDHYLIKDGGQFNVALSVMGGKHIDSRVGKFLGVVLGLAPELEKVW